MSKKNDLLNRQFGKLKVIAYHRNNIWICRCGCGLSADIKVRRVDLLNGVIDNCGCDDGESLEKLKFGKLEVKRLYSVVNRIKRWVCDCDCGTRGIIVPENILINGQKLTCGQCKYENLQGRVFGKLKVVKAINKNRWLCSCNCGSNKEVIVYTWALKSGDINNCGCGERLNIDINNYNPYKVMGDMAIIYAANTGTKFYIDYADYEKIELYRWVEAQGGHLWTRLENGQMINMASAILGIENCKETIVLYKDNNRKNIRKENLEVVERDKYSGRNKLRSNNKTGCTGVSLYGRYNYRAQIMVNGKNIVLGVRSNYEDAVKLRKEAERKYLNGSK